MALFTKKPEPAPFECVICSKPTPLSNNKRRMTCSSECRWELTSRVARKNKNKTKWFNPGFNKKKPVEIFTK